MFFGSFTSPSRCLQCCANWVAFGMESGAGTVNLSLLPEKLYNMCIVGNIEEVRKALTGGVDPTQKVGQSGFTALHAAAKGGHLVVVELLLEQPGVDVNAATDRGFTVLHITAGFGHMEILALLLRQPGLDLNVATHGGSTALHLSAGHGHLEVVTLLLQQPQVDPNVRDQDGNTPIMRLLKRNHNVDIKRACLQSFVDSNEVDLDGKDGEGDGLEDLAR